MKRKEPFIHCIKTPVGFYVYDVNTDKIVEVSEKTYTLLKTDPFSDNKEISYLKKMVFLRLIELLKLCIQKPCI